MISSQKWEKIKNVSLESWKQIFEKTWRIQDPVQNTANNKNLKEANKLEFNIHTCML